jgi:beta-xylosidase
VDDGGAIDPATFVDDGGAHYLLWKNDGNSRGVATWISIQRLSDDELALQGTPTKLITVDQAWEGILVEGPTLWKHNGKYYLFYSANDYTSPRYAVGYAVADQVLGPYRKPDEPFLQTSIEAGIVGPGGQDLVTGPDGNTWILFHAWSPGAYRNLNLARVVWDGDTPRVEGLSREPMAGPR